MLRCACLGVTLGRLIPPRAVVHPMEGMVRMAVVAYGWP